MRNDKSPFDESIFNAWEPLAFPHRFAISEDERFARWLDLYSLWRVDGSWLCSSEDAALIAIVGWTLMMQREDYTRALALTEEWLAHPSLRSKESPEDGTHLRIELTEFRVRKGTSLAMLGRVEEALEAWRSVLAEGVTVTLHVVRSALVETLQYQEDPALRDFAVELAGSFSGGIRLAKRMREAATNADAATLLQQADCKPVSKRTR